MDSVSDKGLRPLSDPILTGPPAPRISRNSFAERRSMMNMTNPPALSDLMKSSFGQQSAYLLSPQAAFFPHVSFSPSSLDSPLMIFQNQTMLSPASGGMPFPQFLGDNSLLCFNPFAGERMLNSGESGGEVKKRPLTPTALRRPLPEILKSESDPFPEKPTKSSVETYEERKESPESLTRQKDTLVSAPAESPAPPSATEGSLNELSPDKPSDDGYNWRKYGQKIVKGCSDPRSYFKCTHRGCDAKKKVFLGENGEHKKREYSGLHNHPRPMEPKRFTFQPGVEENLSFKFMAASVERPSPATVKTGLAEDEKTEMSLACSEDVAVDCLEDNDSETVKKIRVHEEQEAEVKVPRVVIHVRSNVDILDDGYRWRKYGQKIVRANPNPRNYYKCTFKDCKVRKHIERSSTEPDLVSTTYEGKHEHEIPSAKIGREDSGRPIEAHVLQPEEHKRKASELTDRQPATLN